MSSAPSTTTTEPTASVRLALRRVSRLWLIAALVSAAGLVATFALSLAAPDQVNWVMWLRSTVITVACFAFIAVTSAAARGHRGAYLRTKVVSTIAPIGVIALILAPDSGLPLWMKAEQGVLGVIVAIIAVILWRPEVSRAFPKDRSDR